MIDQITELAKYGPTGVAIAAILAFVWLANKLISQVNEQRKFADESLQHIERLQKQTIEKLTKSVDKNTDATVENTKLQHEQFKFMKNLNGKLTGIIKSVVEENSKS
jgi:uncharacterized protein YktB (UPF0637 family)